jgi:hypothetical protein
MAGTLGTDVHFTLICIGMQVPRYSPPALIIGCAYGIASGIARSLPLGRLYTATISIGKLSELAEHCVIRFTRSNS